MSTETKDPIVSLLTALAKAQSAFPEIGKAKTAKPSGNFGGYDYASLDMIITALRPVFAAHGLSQRHEYSYEGDKILVTCVIAHVDGGQLTSTMPCHLSTSSQDTGKAITYARRYTLLGLSGVFPCNDADDDDGLESALKASIEATRKPASGAPTRDTATEAKIKAAFVAARPGVPAEKVREEFRTWLQATHKAASLADVPNDKLADVLRDVTTGPRAAA